MFDYLVICTETANEDASSVCQIGFASVKYGKIVGRLSKNIIPGDEFDPFYSSIHGIGPQSNNSAIEFPDIHRELGGLMEDQIVVTPTVFDRISFVKAAHKNKLVLPRIKWLDLTSIAKNTWPEWRESGYTLNSIAEKLSLGNIEHGSPNKAPIVSNIIERALTETGKSIADWAEILGGSDLSANERTLEHICEFDGEEIVFEGEFYLPKDIYGRLSESRGFNIASSVTPRTSILCIGLLGISEKSNSETGTSLAIASNLIQQGAYIRLIDEDDLWSILADTNNEEYNKLEEERYATRLKAEEGYKNAEKITEDQNLAEDIAIKNDTDISDPTQATVSIKITEYEEQNATTPASNFMLFLAVFFVTIIISILISQQ